MKVFCVAIIIGMAFQGLHSYMHKTLWIFFFLSLVGVKVTLLPFPLGKCPHLDVFISYLEGGVLT